MLRRDALHSLPAEDHADADVVDREGSLRRHGVAVEQLGESDGFEQKDVPLERSEIDASAEVEC